MRPAWGLAALILAALYYPSDRAPIVIGAGFVFPFAPANGFAALPEKQNPLAVARGFTCYPTWIRSTIDYQYFIQQV